ncbi:hypothetical protein F8388_019187 [Cannabis sativa]|uniref:Uncharacterized protein n=1 Tax=Cannabis sativa TaxID=3483 RepID=A0A7J6F5F1_CANSA|nr:hypothetical protein F8388_019187 [Cannabis sativa]
MEKLVLKLRNLDAYPKVNEDFYNRTFSGGIITIVSSLVMLILFFSEFSLFLHTVKETKLVVDTSRGETLRINVILNLSNYIPIELVIVATYTGHNFLKNPCALKDLCIDTTYLSMQFDVTFPVIACSLLSLDALDISGEQHLDIRHNIVKKRIDAHGNLIEARQEGIGAPKIEKPLQRHGGRLEHNETYCGSCFGAEASDDECCNSCEEVREAYRKKGWAMTNTDLIDQCKREGFIQKIKDEDGEGCNIEGSLEVNKVAGNFHFSPGKSFHQANMFLQDLLALQTDTYNISHKINKLAFGDYFPGAVNPLDGVKWTQETPSGSYQYFIKVVPTKYTNIRGHDVQSNQFSVTEHFKNTEAGHFRSLPGVFFYYDFSPIKVCSLYPVSEATGIFTIAGIIDSFVYHGQKAMRKKMEIGKFG